MSGWSGSDATDQFCEISVYLSAEHWNDFLQNGYLELHPDSYTGFSFDLLSPASARALLRFLEQQYGGVEDCPPILGWLRVRHQENGTR